MALENIIAEIDSQIAKLEQARGLLNGSSSKPYTGGGGKKRGRPAQGSIATGFEFGSNKPAKKKRKMSAEGRRKIAEAQRKRWALIQRGAKG